MLLDTLDGCAREAGAAGFLCPPGDLDALSALAGAGAPVVAQEGRGLGDALRLGLARLSGDGPVALVSGDLPGVPPGEVARAFALLAGGADLVLGPALDGGYWLIAATGSREPVFRDIPWSTPACHAVTLRRAGEAGLRVAGLRPWRDIDTVADLVALARGGVGDQAPRTRRELEGLTDRRVVEGPAPPALEGSRLVAATPWRSVLEDRLRDDDGRGLTYTYMAVPRAVFCVAVTPEGTMALVRQYRHPVRDMTLEVPAGTVDDGETPAEAAARELAEEVGGVAAGWRHLGTFFSSSAHISLRSDAFLATGVTLSAPAPDAGERLETVLMPAREAVALARSGRLAEGQSALAILLAEPHLPPEVHA
jgi:ADP-ribose pyrophosphatase